jgi:hypothetical protein
MISARQEGYIGARILWFVVGGSRVAKSLNNERCSLTLTNMNNVHFAPISECRLPGFVGPRDAVANTGHGRALVLTVISIIVVATTAFLL